MNEIRKSTILTQSSNTMPPKRRMSSGIMDSSLKYHLENAKKAGVTLNYLDKIEKAINRLGDFPLSGSIPRYSILRKQGYRVLIVERHLVFYKVNDKEKKVTVYAIVDGRREYKNLI